MNIGYIVIYTWRLGKWGLLKIKCCGFEESSFMCGELMRAVRTFMRKIKCNNI